MADENTVFFCPHCGKPLSAQAGFCPHCGARIERPAEPVPATQEEVSVPVQETQPEAVQAEVQFQDTDTQAAHPESPEPQVSAADMPRPPVPPMQSGHPEQPTMMQEDAAPRMAPVSRGVSPGLVVALLILVALIAAGAVYLYFALIRPAAVFSSAGDAPAAMEQQTGAHPARMSSYQRGHQLVLQMDRKVKSEAYLALYSSSGSLGPSDTYARLRNGNYTQPKNVYKLSVSPADLQDLIAAAGEDASDLQKLPEDLRTEVEHNIPSILIGMLNGRAGAESIAIGSLFTASAIYYDPNDWSDMIYVYDYGEGSCPAVIIFRKGEDGAASASGSFILPDDFSAGSVDELRTSLANNFGENAARLFTIEKLPAEALPAE